MGMKKSAGMLSLAMMMAMASEDGYGLVSRGNVGSSKEPEPPQKKKVIPFKDLEGVAKTIEDYKLILKGECKKGRIKQARIKEKIENWLETGILTEEDLNL